MGCAAQTVSSSASSEVASAVANVTHRRSWSLPPGPEPMELGEVPARGADEEDLHQYAPRCESSTGIVLPRMYSS